MGLVLGPRRRRGRQGQPSGDAKDALKLARAAAAALGRDVIPSFSPWQVFGPMTVAMFHAENAMIQDRPDVTLSVGAQIAGRDFPVPRNYLRHRLDMANAHVATGQHAAAVGVLQEVKSAAPEWLTQQRYAHEILAGVITHRRALTDGMRDLAGFLSLAL